MSTYKILLSLALAASVTACVVYDPERGVFVSSSAQLVDIKMPQSINTKIYLLQFNPPKHQIVGYETRVAGVGFAPINFQYRFDEVDQQNLRASIIGSFNNTVSITVLDSPSETSSQSIDGMTVGIVFNQAGIVWGTVSKAIIDSEVFINKSGKVSTTPIRVEGASAMSVAAAKNEAIRIYVTKLAQVISEN